MSCPELSIKAKAFTLKLLLPLLALNLAACCLVAPRQAQAKDLVMAPTPPMGVAPATQATPATPAAPPTAAAPAPGLKTTEGLISLVEPDGTLIIMPSDGNNTVVYVRPETKVTRNGFAATLRDLKAGDRATARHGAGGAAAEINAQGK